MDNINSIPKKAIEQLKDCTTAEDVIALGGQYGIEVTPEDAEAALTFNEEQIGEFVLGKRQKHCEDCGHWINNTGDDNYYYCHHGYSHDGKKEACGEFMNKWGMKC